MKQLYKFTKMQMFVTYDKAKPNTENIRRLNLATIRHMTIRVSGSLLLN